MASEMEDSASERYRQILEESNRGELLYALPILEHVQKVVNALDTTSRNLVGASQIEHERKTDTPRSRRPYQFALTPQRELPEDDEHDARVIADSSFKALDAIATVLERSLRAALFVLESEDSEQQKYAARLLIDQLNSTIGRLLRLSAAPGNTGICGVANERMEFPSIVSLSRVMNNEREELILRQLKLGRSLPFRIDPRTTYTRYTLLAMQIVSFIESDRRQKDSIYRKVVPEFHKKAFSDKYYSAWNKVIGFHLDFFQSPDPRRVKITAQQDNSDLRQEMEKMMSLQRENHFRRSTNFGPLGEIAEMLEFKYRDGEAVKMNAGTLYNRVKFKVIDAAMALLPK
jgi:hypothetical protein